MVSVALAHGPALIPQMFDRMGRFLHKMGSSVGNQRRIAYMTLFLGTFQTLCRIVM